LQYGSKFAALERALAGLKTDWDWKGLDIGSGAKWPTPSLFFRVFASISTFVVFDPSHKLGKAPAHARPVLALEDVYTDGFGPEGRVFGRAIISSLLSMIQGEQKKERVWPFH